MPDKPAKKFSPPYEDIHLGVKHLLMDRLAQESYEIQLEAALKSCSQK
jgi:hypothetical protein